MATESLSALGATMLESSSSAPESRDVAPGTLIGRYVVLAKLGAGGMGIVLAAYDPELDRKIALKLLKGGQSSARTRLQREAQALAKLDHRNVVSVHDVGVHDGQLFVAMEFVAGKTLGAWMTELEHPRPWREVLRVFAEAGRGLAAAHEAGLVHRDFKPENVMLGDDGRVRVMDFGLARAEGGDDQGELADVKPSQLLTSPLTQTGAVLGTPAYMAPEQFKGTAADARSDQFGFCVSLYEALHGTRPFVGKTVHQLFQAIARGQVAPAPKSVAVPTWLRAVVMRGLAAKPDERWPSMRALLDALADDPAVRRRKWFAVAVAVALVGGVTWALSSVIRDDAQTCTGFEERLAGVWDDGRRADVQRAIEGTKLSYAPGTWERVEQRLDEYTQQWLTAREQACEATRSGEQSNELLDLRMACLDQRLQHVRATVEVLAEADETVVKKAVDAVTSLPRLERCADVDALMASIPPPEDPKVAERVAALDEQLAKAEALQQTGKYADGLLLADAVLTEAVALDYEPLLARAWLRQGYLQSFVGNYEQAEATLEQAYESAVGQQMATEAAEAATRLVFVVGDKLARHEDGRRWAKDAKPLARAAGTDEARAQYLAVLGGLAYMEGKYEEARAYHEQARVISEKALGPEHPYVLVSLNGLGVVANAEGKHEEARGYYERALAIGEKTLGPEHPRVATYLMNMGTVAADEGKYEEARGYFEQALTMSEKALGPEHPGVATHLMNVGNIVQEEGNYEEARNHYERALAIREKALGLDHPDVAISLMNLGILAYREGKYEESRGHHERALAIQEQALGPDHPIVARSLHNLGGVAFTEGKYEESRGHLERAVTVYTTSSGDPAYLADARFTLALALWDAPAEAGRDRERARTLAELARSFYAQAGEQSATELQEVQTWQAEHRE